jgi:hypothetical protein
VEELLTDQTFQKAYDRVRARHSNSGWFTLSPREITALIYREMRDIDLARASECDAKPTDRLAAE